VKATTLAGGHIECRTNLDIPTEAVVSVNLLIGGAASPLSPPQFSTIAKIR
jgi:hypothetical protein